MSAIISEQKDSAELLAIQRQLKDITNNTALTLDFSRERVLSSLALAEHTSIVTALTVLPNGLLASGSEDCTIKLWDLTSNTCVATLTGHAYSVTALTLLSNGLLASGSEDSTIKLWDITAKTCVATLTGHTNRVTALTVLPNGRLASGSRDRTIKLWDLTSNTCVATLTGHAYSVTALTLLSNGLLASGSEDSTIKLWDLTAKTCVANLTGHTDHVTALTVLPNGRLASGSRDRTIKLWDITSRTCVATLTGHTERVAALTGLPNGRLASGSWDHTIKLWDLTSNTCVATLTGHTHNLTALMVLLNGRLASGSWDKTIKLWDYLAPRWLSLKEMTALLEALTTNCSLVELSLPNIHLDDRAVLLLQKIVSTHPPLQTCDLKNVTLSSIYVNQLYQAFKTRAASLPELQLLHEGLATLGAKTKAELLSSPQAASTLELKIEKENQSKEVPIEPHLTKTFTGHTSIVHAYCPMDCLPVALRTTPSSSGT